MDDGGRVSGWLVLAAAVAVLACDRPAGGGHEGPVALGPRVNEEWNKCLYVYGSATERNTKIRECLVLQFRWPPAVAERRISAWVDSVAMVQAVLDSEVRARDSVAHLEASLARVARDSLRRAERRRRDSVYLATHEERLDGAPTPFGDEMPAGAAWVMDTRTKAYYPLDCEAATRIPVAAREFFVLRTDAEKAGWPSRQPRCQ